LLGFIPIFSSSSTGQECELSTVMIMVLVVVVGIVNDQLGNTMDASLG
jgi:hypothetical protein